MPAAPILIVSGTWEDILTVDAGEALMLKLTDGNHSDPGISWDEKLGQHSRNWVLLPGVFHNFEVFSGNAFSAVKQWLVESRGVELVSVEMPESTFPRWVLWITGMAGLFLVAGGGVAYGSLYPASGWNQHLVIASSAKFFAGRFWLWLPGILVGALVLMPFAFLPLGFPALNVYYVVFLSGYGILSLVLYRMGRMPGIEGRADLRTSGITGDKNRFVLGLTINLILFLLLVGWIRSGWYWTPPRGARAIWLVIFSSLTALGFLASWIDRTIITNLPASRRFWLNLSAYLPFFLYVAGMAFLQSWSGFLSALLGLVVLFLADFQGRMTLRLTGSVWLAAIFPAVLIWLWVMPQGVLFGF
jgi:hypothetical protein